MIHLKKIEVDRSDDSPQEIEVVCMNVVWMILTHIYTYFFNKKEYNEPLINSMDYSVLFFSYFEHYLVFSSQTSKKYVPNNSKIKLLKKPTKQHAFSTHYNLHACANSDHVESIFCHDNKV